MPRNLIISPEPLADISSIPVERIARLQAWLVVEVEDAISARIAQEKMWMDVLRRYEGVPKNPVRNIPIENAPNIEVTLGAIATDSIFAQAVDLIYNISPLVTVRATNAAFKEHQKAMQRFVEYVATNESGLRAESEHTLLDDVQLGTGVYYVPWVERKKKTDIVETISQGPRIFAVPPEDCIVPGGSKGNLQDVRWCALRFWYNWSELALNATELGWDINGVSIAGNTSMIRQQREHLARTTESGKRLGDLYEIMVVFAEYDIDEDGINEDLLVVWDRTSAKVMKLDFMPYDHRPVEKMCYQIRGHSAYGIGVVEMLSNFQDGATDIFNFWAVNMLLANCRIFVGPSTIPMPFKIYPGKYLDTDPEKFAALPMADVYNSGPQALATIMGLAERRVGTNDMTLPRPSQVLGSRTPATTAMAMFQQVNRRFTPAFDSMRLATAGAIMQCMYRYQEKLLAQDLDVESHIMQVMGEEEGPLVLEVLRDRNFDQGITVEMTASSSTVNKEVERQNAMFLVNILAQYYQRVLELVTIAANPQVPMEVKTVASKIASAAGEVIERTIRTFDQIRDPESFIVQIDEELDKIQAEAPALQALYALLGQTSGRGIEAQPQNGAIQ